MARTFVLVTLTLVGLASLSSVATAVGSGKALYIGGTLEGFPVGVLEISREVEGQIVTGSDSAFTFDGGRWGSLAIPYGAISSLQYGSDVRPRPGLMPIYFQESREQLRLPRRGFLVIPWDPFEQYTKDVHYLLTVSYQDEAGHEQTVAFELGKNLVRPTLQALEQRTGRPVEFTDVDVCVQFRGADACGYGKPAELGGLTKVHLDTNISQENRELILAELQKGAPELAIVPDPVGAEIILTFRSAWSHDPGCPCEGGHGEALIVRGASRRVVLVFTGRKKGIWGKKPAIEFGGAFVAAFKTANGGGR